MTEEEKKISPKTDAEYKHEVAAFMKKARRLMGMDKYEFADMLKYSRRQVDYWESAQKAPPFAVMENIAMKLELQGHHLEPPSRD